MKLAEGEAVFALKFNAEAPAIVQNVVSIAWTKDVLSVLKQTKDEATAQAKRQDDEAFIHLPFANLRGQLQLMFSNWVSMKDDLGLRSPYVADTPEPWGYLGDGNPREALHNLHDAFARWSEGPLAHFSESRGAYAVGIGRLRQLNLDRKVFSLQPSRLQLFPWNAAPKVAGVTRFDITPGVLAARLAGREIFPELGPVANVVGGTGRNKAEIMTRPSDGGDGGLFSLVCEISMETLPGALQPLIYLKFKRRRWATSFNSRYPTSPTIGGFVFPHAERPGSAFRFTVMWRKKKWTTDQSYQLIADILHLTPGYEDEGVLSYPSDHRASVAVMVKAEVAEASDTKVLAGVPMADQADAFVRIATELEELGLEPFTNFSVVKSVLFKAPPLSMFKADLALARLLSDHSLDEDVDGDLNEAIESATGSSAQRWFKSDLPTPDPQHGRVVNAVRTLVSQTAFQTDSTRRTIYLVCHGNEDIDWMKSTIRSMLGEEVTIASVRLPENTHGPLGKLPLADCKKKERFDARMREWLEFARQIQLQERAMVLVQAPRYYEAENGKFAHDDVINKLAARKALASLGCTVQYLLPSETGKLDKFLPRLQAAVLDLVFGHSGSVWGLKQVRQTCFSDTQSPPNWVCGISSLMVQTEWAGWQSAFVSTRLNCATGEAEVRFAHRGADPVMTPWMRFDLGAQYLASNRIELPSGHLNQRALLANFIISTFDELISIDPNAVVFIDSTRNAKLASWLSDSGVQETEREVAPKVFVSKRWPTLRLIRIREQAPTIGQQRFFDGTLPDGGPVRTWTATQRLFEVHDTSAPTFWSLARPLSHHKRGASCYRTMLLPNSRKTPQNPEPFSPFPPRADKQYLNAQAVEIVILQKQPTDENSQLASFAQHLRAGMLTAWNDRWVSTPTPLRIVEKLSQYLRA